MSIKISHYIQTSNIKQFNETMKTGFFIAILSIILCFMINGYLNPTNYVSFNKTIEKLENDDDKMILNFYEDKIDYIIYYDNVDPSILEDLGIDDEVSIKLKENYGGSKYTIIYEMSSDNKVIFSLIEHYDNHDKNILRVFIPTVIALIITSFALCFINHEEKDYICSNEIVNWEVDLTILTMVFGLMPFIMFSILYISKMISFNTFGYGFAFIIFFIIGLIGLLWDYYRIIKIKNNKIILYYFFIYKKIIYLNKINKIDIYIGNRFNTIFYNSNNEIIYTFKNSINLINNDIFKEVVYLNNINVKYIITKNFIRVINVLIGITLYDNNTDLSLYRISLINENEKYILKINNEKITIYQDDDLVKEYKYDEIESLINDIIIHQIEIKEI